MQIHSADYEKPGTFYLGREYDDATKSLEDKLVLYDSRDLVTHGVVLGMTGSGKTGLCFALLEEAAMDRIPAIVIDPKGDISNFLLTFPELTGESFRPWINEEDAEKKGRSPDDYAADQAAMWEKGLAEWGQDAARIRTMRETVDINIFTPGSNAGIPVSILSSLEAPPFEVVDDAEVFSERIESTASSLLGLLGIDADPINSREHILLATILAHAWRAEENLDLEKIIMRVQQPPFAKVGVIDIDTFFPEKKRMDFAMAINNLLAAPGFSAWLTGEALDIKRMLHTPEGKPRISIFSIAHLGDSERMFFVSLLLNQMTGWMRSQSGTTSLRALLYMDEIYGYLPPTMNPPSKKPMMILLKQARAFGLGLLLATQNPVDLDYKALSNIGTWFLGRLQTERDKARVLDGLEGAASSQGGKFDRASMDRMLASLGNRIFLMNNVHDDHPVVFSVRWVMTYLRGPLTRTQIKKLMDPKRASFGAGGPAPALASGGTTSAPPLPATAPAAEQSAAPSLPSAVPRFFFPANGAAATPGEPLIYLPALAAAAEVTFSDTAHDVFVMRRVTLLHKLGEDTAAVDPGTARRSRIDLGTLGAEPAPGEVSYAPLPLMASKTPAYTEMKNRTVDWLYQNETVELLHCAEYDMGSKTGESEGDFRARLTHRARESRDGEMEALRRKYQARFQTLTNERERASAAVEREAAQARDAKISTAVSIGQTILGAIFGRKKISVSTVSRGGAAVRGAGKAMKESGDVGRAEDRLAWVEQQMTELQEELDSRLMEIRLSADPDRLVLEKVPVRPLKKNIRVTACGLAWLPYHRTADGTLEAAWAET